MIALLFFSGIAIMALPFPGIAPMGLPIMLAGLWLALKGEPS